MTEPDSGVDCQVVEASTPEQMQESAPLEERQYLRHNHREIRDQKIDGKNDVSLTHRTNLSRGIQTTSLLPRNVLIWARQADERFGQWSSRLDRISLY